jgi:hypothetical protein
MLDHTSRKKHISTPLYLKITAWRADSKWKGERLPLALDNVKRMFMPRQAVLKKLDPSWSLPVPTVRVLLELYQREYQCLIIQTGWMPDLTSKER